MTAPDLRPLDQALRCHESAFVRADDLAIRASAAEAVATFAGLNPQTPCSLIVDDADDLRYTVLALLPVVALTNLIVAAVWRPDGAAIDRRLLDLEDNLTVARTTPYAVAEMVADALNRQSPGVGARGRDRRPACSARGPDAETRIVSKS